MLPDFGHFPDLIALACVALLAVGLGSLTGARRIEVALAAGWGVAVTVLVVLGTLTALPLEPAMMVLAGLGAVGLGRAGASAWSGRPVLEGAMAARVLLLAAPLVVVIESIGPASWDEFSHWLPNLAYLFGHGRFPTLAAPNDLSAHPGYPYGLALVGFGVSLLLGRLSESAGIFWNALMMLMAAAGIAGMIERRSASAWSGSAAESRRHAWASAGLGLLLGGFLCPSFLPNVVLSNMTDGATAAVLTIIGALLFDWFGEDGTDAERRRFRIALPLAFCCAALVALRQTNLVLFFLLLLGSLCAVWVERRRIGPARWISLVLPLALTTGLWWLWNLYSLRQIPGGQFSLLSPAQWRWSLFPTTLGMMLHTMATKIGLFGLIAFVAWRAVVSLRGVGQSAERALPIVVGTLCLGNMGFLAFTYLAADFPESDVLGAAQFGRYVGQTGQVAVLALVATVPVRWLALATRARVGALLCIASLLAPLIGARAMRYDLRTPAALLRRIGREIERRLPAGAPIRLVSPVGNGFDALVVGYQLRFASGHVPEAPRPVSLVSDWQGLSDEALKAQTTSAPFVWLGEGGPRVGEIFGLPLPAGCSYLLAAATGRFDILERWQSAVRTARSRPFQGLEERSPTCG